MDFKTNLPFCPKDLLKLLILKQSHNFKIIHFTKN